MNFRFSRALPPGGITHAQALAARTTASCPARHPASLPKHSFPHFSSRLCNKGTATQYQTGVFYPTKSISKKRTPTIVNLTVKRRYLTEREGERLMDFARKYGRHAPDRFKDFWRG